ncbi:NAD(P) transhydrogenase alpha subunit [Streptomyces laurentii]|uniref:NAD(P) transhydrogenase alpha subunit n=1 Tax=Streptomyces laurentii TaxID=39478 RepID=A0A160NXK1_STRLU|nr:NAD(P) transhydrogenase alpha subunit [Streptomyces laurentii]
MWWSGVPPLSVPVMSTRVIAAVLTALLSDPVPTLGDSAPVVLIEGRTNARGGFLQVVRCVRL